ncbi:MAG: hypothetical protein HOJ48_10035 [Desulfobacula sp.]|jgi:hypothetical protein|nr:hypothetical protein [Desulfobacula sp.]
MAEDTFKIRNCVIQMFYKSQIHGMTKEAGQLDMQALIARSGSQLFIFL